MLSTYAHIKKKVVRANHMPYMKKQLRKAIMRISALENKYYKSKRLEDKETFKKQRNYCKSIQKRNLKEIADNKTFWKTFLSNKGGFHK